MSKNNTATKSFFGELNLMSLTATIGLVVLVIVCFVFYGLMSSSPKKKVMVVDDAEIFTENQIEELESSAKQLSKKKDINVVIVTTRDKGNKYTNSDEDCAKFAGDFYKKNCIKTSLVNNSGICILVDLTEDEPGRRFFWLYTYGTAYFAVSDDTCSDIFRSHKSDLSEQKYYEALEGILYDLDDYHYQNTAVVNFICLILPAALAALITSATMRAKKMDVRPASRVYKGDASSVKSNDIITKTEKIYTPQSSGSSGGGGGGFSGGGGGGGGHSGGGGGRF